jgi:hypothetical protein
MATDTTVTTGYNFEELFEVLLSTQLKTFEQMISIVQKASYAAQTIFLHNSWAPLAYELISNQGSTEQKREIARQVCFIAHTLGMSREAVESYLDISIRKEIAPYSNKHTFPLR